MGDSSAVYCRLCMALSPVVRTAPCHLQPALLGIVGRLLGAAFPLFALPLLDSKGIVRQENCAVYYRGGCHGFDMQRRRDAPVAR